MGFSKSQIIPLCTLSAAALFFLCAGEKKAAFLINIGAVRNGYIYPPQADSQESSIDKGREIE